jgi:aryl-alcohol dehydrogenase-like predicted oxidoreductase
MEYRTLGRSGLKVPALSFGAATFGGRGPLFSAWGQTGAAEAERLVDICLEAGANLFDTADVYSDGASEEILGAAIKGRRDKVLISTKTALPLGEGPDDAGASLRRLPGAVEAALKRLGTDHIDLLQLHAFDAGTPLEETLYALDMLVRAGKVRYVGASNFSGWQLMKSLGISESRGWPRFVAHQVYYSLAGRDYEWELMPLGVDQGVGALVWSPLAWGRLTGKIRRGQPLPPESRLHETAQWGPPVDDEKLYQIVEALDAVAAETERSVPQVAIAWLLTRPTVASVILGARTESQLRDNLAAASIRLTADQLARLEAASTLTAPYPYFPYRANPGFARLSPAVV